MNNVYIVYIKVSRGKWEQVLETPSRRVFEETIYGLFEMEPMVQVITKYKEPRGEHILVAFNNKAPKDSFDLEKVYRFLPKNK